MVRGEGNLHPRRPFASTLANTPAEETKDSTCAPNPYGSRSQSQEERIREEEED